MTRTTSTRVRSLFITGAAAALIVGATTVAFAQTAAEIPSVTSGMPTTKGGSSATTSPTTLAPVAPGSTQMHRVETPKAPDRTTATGGNTNGGAN